MIKDENFYVVQGWMLNRLKLKGNDLIVYALLYSFSQDGESEFKGNIAYIMDFTGASRQTIKNIIGKLISLGYVEKEERNRTTGKTNGYKCVPIDRLKIPEEGEAKNLPPTSQNLSTPVAKNLPPRSQNLASLSLENNTYINSKVTINDKKEGKNEVNINQTARVSAREGIPDFSKMTDEELLSWGETAIPDFSDEAAAEIYALYGSEIEKRKASARWRGKVVKNSAGFERLKSYDEILREYGVSGALRMEIHEFIKHCALNSHRLTNSKLEDILSRLCDAYGQDEAAKCESVRRAISGGYCDIRELRP